MVIQYTFIYLNITRWIPLQAQVYSSLLNMIGKLVIGILYCLLQKKMNKSHLKFVNDNNCHIQILDEIYQNLYMTIY